MNQVPTSVLFILFMHRANFMGALNLIRTKMVEEQQSAFDINGNGVFLIGSVVVLLAIEIISVILFRAKQVDIKSKTYKVLVFSDIFLAFVNPYLLLMVLEDYQNRGWGCHLVFYAIAALVVGYVSYSSDENVNNYSFAVGCTYLGLFLVSLSFVLVISVPIIHNWVVYLTLYSYMVMEVINIGIVAVKFFTHESDATQQYKKSINTVNGKGFNS
ncbi:hypothetical protein QVD17_09070 [Tagetes erecta]|uniref:Uncharacterized protein n=1 Tax=Tagetes erecta TaxID=13708 RepID=A0AAD8L086_TARER|nr:hypothetical protein QVD17_09070 [Tagetes erecta]